jgi:predicted nuclease of predicted toxin-antitoxin system
MMARLYFDEDSMRHALVVALRARGVDVVTALEVGMINRDDAEHLDYAAAHGRVLFSFNVGDFYDLHARYLAEGKSHAGIILARQQIYSVGELLRRLSRLINARSAEEMKDRVEFLSAWGRG